MSLLPAQNTGIPLAAASTADGDALFDQARRLADTGEYAAATAYASLATAAFAAKAAVGAAPLPIYPGTHEPEILPWCGTCRAPNRRETSAGEQCPQCGFTDLRVRACRYCVINLEKRPVNGNEEPWLWVDETNNVSCPQAPNPRDAPAAPSPLPDVWPERLWELFFEHWSAGFQSFRSVTVHDLVSDTYLRPYLPRTTYGDYHPIHLEHWFSQRAGAKCGRYTLVQAEDPAPDGPTRWQVRA
ncbi:hypothetical protein ACIOMM_30730 [Streptomyces sp. NPDC087908]|uniref:hypothetical protein n=1 Tax=Streptomyces sp. NPDC087908 TaxID=3365820 RepID=UPI0038130580